MFKKKKQKKGITMIIIDLIFILIVTGFAGYGHWRLTHKIWLTILFTSCASMGMLLTHIKASGHK